MATAKKPAKKKTTRPSAKKHDGYISFKRAQREEPFFTFRFTVQSVYWLILGALVIGLAAWVMALNMKVQAIYDQVEADSSSLEQSNHNERKSD